MTNRKTILCIGDSIVEGYPYDLEDSWVAHAEQHWNRLQENPRDDLWINAGISGQLTSEIRFRLGPALNRYRPDLVILSCGTNDFIFLDGPRSEADSAWANIQAMAAAALQSGAKVILTAPPMTIPELASRRWSDGTDYDAVNRNWRTFVSGSLIGVRSAPQKRYRRRHRQRCYCGTYSEGLNSG